MARTSFLPVFNEHVWQDILSYNNVEEGAVEHTQLLLEYLYNREGRRPARVGLSVVEVLPEVSAEEAKENISKGLLAFLYCVGDEELVSFTSNRDEPQPRYSLSLLGRDDWELLREFMDSGEFTIHRDDGTLSSESITTL